MRPCDTLENHIRMAGRLGHDIICLPVSDAGDLKPETGYRYFDIPDIGSASKICGRPIFAFIDGPFQDLVNRMGLMTVLTDCIRNQEDLSHTYKTLSEKTLGFIDKILEQPVSAIVLADDFASCSKLDSLLHIFKSWGIDGFCAIQSSANNLKHIVHLFDGSIMIMAGIEPELLETRPPSAGPLEQFRQRPLQKRTYGTAPRNLSSGRAVL